MSYNSLTKAFTINIQYHIVFELMLVFDYTIFLSILIVNVPNKQGLLTNINFILPYLEAVYRRASVLPLVNITPYKMFFNLFLHPDTHYFNPHNTPCQTEFAKIRLTLCSLNTALDKGQNKLSWNILEQPPLLKLAASLGTELYC